MPADLGSGAGARLTALNGRPLLAPPRPSSPHVPTVRSWPFPGRCPDLVPPSARRPRRTTRRGGWRFTYRPRAPLAVGHVRPGGFDPRTNQWPERLCGRRAGRTRSLQRCYGMPSGPTRRGRGRLHDLLGDDRWRVPRHGFGDSRRYLSPPTGRIRSARSSYTSTRVFRTGTGRTP